MKEKRPKVGLGIIIKKEDKILLGKRKNSHGEGDWCPPGGHLEFFETLEECAKRETKEETGLEVSELKFLAVTNDFFEKENKHYITIFMIAEAEGELKVMEPEKCEKWEYFEIDNLPENLFKPFENLLKQDKIK